MFPIPKRSHPVSLVFLFCFLFFTFVRHHVTGLEVHLGAAGHADLVDVVAERVAAVLPAAEAQAFVEGLLGVAAVDQALLLYVQQRVNEQVNGALVGTFDQLVHIYEGQRIQTLSSTRQKCISCLFDSGRCRC